MKILIIQTAYPGDVILSTALAESVHHHLPDARIDFAVRKGNESLFRNHPFVKKVHVWNKKENKIANLVSLIRQIRKEKYDEVFNLQRFFSSGLITLFSGGKSTSGFVKNPLSFFFTHRHPHLIGNGEHETSRNHQLIKHLAIDEKSKPRLYPSDNDFESVKKYTAMPYVCMAPASVWFTKQLPAVKWAELVQLLKGRFKVYLIGGKEDDKLAEEIRSMTKSETINLTGKLSFLQSAALMKGAVMNYVNDSAPLHLASAVNAPVTVFFLSTVPEFGFGPLSDNSKIVSAHPAPSCRPCGLHGMKACPQKHFNCAMQIQINESYLP